MAATSEPRQRLALAVSMGDPAGIGLEVTLKAWRARLDQSIPPFVLYADPSVVAERALALGLDVPVATLASAREGIEAFTDALPVVPLPPLAAAAHPGVPDAANAPAVIAAIERAVEAIVAGEASGLVTNPIAKSVLAAAGFPHPGHTDFLGELAARHFPGSPSQAVMMLAAPELRVVPLTVHIPLARVPGEITRQAIEATVRITHQSLVRDFRLPSPRIAVTGLNPHAGEDGTLGREEIEVIAPAISALRSAGMDVSGPHPADTLFHAGARATYDAAVCMYHDQALIPFKTIAFDTGVNVTLGLPFVRTSPDHGTAFDIAARGCASAQSFIEAVKLGAEIAAARARGAPS